MGRHHGPGSWDGLWEKISHRVVARPLLVWTVSVLLLLPLAAIGLNVRPEYRPTGELSASSPSIRGMKAIQKHFNAGETGPLTVLLTAAADWDSPEGHDLIGQVSQTIARLDNVAEVRSLTQPLGTAMPLLTAKPGALSGLLQMVRPNANNLLKQAQQIARDFYIAELPESAERRHVARLDVILRSDPFDPASTVTLNEIQTRLREDLPQSKAAMGWVDWECFGQTVHSRDLAEVTETDRVRVNLLVLGGIFLILLVLLRHVWVAAYLLLTVLFSYFATLGATALAAAAWSGRPLDQMDWRVPFFLFTILVAVGEDYNILLVTRILQERRRYGADEGTRRGLSRTGGTITACGLIMAGTFATLMLAGLNTLVQVGFALAFGVLLDTFVVRPFLVPTFLLLMWRGPGKPQTADEEELPESDARQAA
jgi:RND superfamily putative drug exporter